MKLMRFDEIEEEAVDMAMNRARLLSSTMKVENLRERERERKHYYKKEQDVKIAANMTRALEKTPV